MARSASSPCKTRTDTRYAHALNPCEGKPSCVSEVNQRYQAISDANDRAWLAAQASCRATNDCTALATLVNQGSAWGQGFQVAVSTDALAPDASARRNQEAQANNAATITALLNRPLSEEVRAITTPAASEPESQVFNPQERTRYVSAIGAQNNQTMVTVGLVAGAVLASKGGQAIARVVVENGEKLLRFIEHRYQHRLHPEQHHTNWQPAVEPTRR